MDDLCDMISECNLMGNPHKWWMYSGATHHVCANKDLFSTFSPAQVEKKIYMAKSATAKVEGTGKVCLKITFGKVLTLNNVFRRTGACPSQTGCRDVTAAKKRRTLGPSRFGMTVVDWASVRVVKLLTSYNLQLSSSNCVWKQQNRYGLRKFSISYKNNGPVVHYREAFLKNSVKDISTYAVDAFVFEALPSQQHTQCNITSCTLRSLQKDLL
ncbi:hypothetical protein CQW23_06295 [Capsicum baccatum]|uniref:Retrovirus-related Pol polyprotein from transposon TNT 1-94-like beta-barrel domain-containing protein n=1 Tax=Capsicum baccatum TaxID=33114 RepID=A0A2G2X300_CAPBA|nr:hypothetical protein CQW23_06295 [Capsicum baccatum]